MNREQLIQRLVERKMSSANRGAFGCVTCLGLKPTNGPRPGSGNNGSTAGGADDSRRGA